MCPEEFGGYSIRRPSPDTRPNAVLVNVNQAKRARCPDAESCCNVPFSRLRAEHWKRLPYGLWKSCGLADANPPRREVVSETNTANQD